MNSTDKSIALIDIALRRRFTFVKLEPNVELIEDSEAKDLFKLINDYIINSLGKDYQIGHSYFMGDIDLDFVLEYKIKPLLEEYFYGDEDKLNEVLSLVGFSDV
jgi:5-methylcytosine-specific restriction protein B